MQTRMVWFFLQSMLLLGGMQASRAEFAFFPRSPALSPDGKVLYFSCQGDLWKVEFSPHIEGKSEWDCGTATRLTVHPSYDTQPIPTNDGTSLLFASDRFSSFDVFVMPITGGPPERLTYSESDEFPYAVSSDGSMVYYSGKELFDYPMYVQILQIPIRGGTPQRLLDTFASQIAVHDSQRFVLTIGHQTPYRQRYRGAYQTDLWLFERGSEPVQLTTHRGVDDRPQFTAHGDLFYRTDQDGWMNVWKMDPSTHTPQQITFVQGNGVRNFAVDRNQRFLILEIDSSFYYAPLSNPQQLTRLLIQIASDYSEYPIQTNTYRNEADDLCVSTDGSELGLVIHSELVLVHRELGGRAVVPVPFSGRDFEPQFRPFSDDTLIFCTDRWGYRALALLVSADSGSVGLRKSKRHRLVRLTFDSLDNHHAQWSPNGKLIAYVKGNGKLWICDANGSNHRQLLDGWSSIQYQWSPDSRWIAFARDDENYNSDIWIVAVDGSIPPINISQHPDEDTDPQWSQDGSILAFTTRRHNNQYDVYFVYLKKSDDERTVEEWKEIEKLRDKKPEKEEDKKKNHSKEKTSTPKMVDSIVIDFDRIHQRLRRLTDWQGEERIVAIDPKGDRFYFLAEVKGKRDLYSVNRLGEDLKPLTEEGANPSAIRFSQDGKTFYFLQNGVPKTLPASGGKMEKTDFTARITIDQRQERLYVLDEGWRGLERGFYDSQMHGVDWSALRNPYRRYAERITHIQDFEDLVEMMLGELNSSHLGFGYRSNPNPLLVAAEMGVTFDPQYQGEGLKVLSLLGQGPAAETKCNLQVGDLILEVNGMKVGRYQPLGLALLGRSNQPTQLQVLRNGKPLETTIIPVSLNTIREMAYREMEQRHRDSVHQWSNQRLAYIHIQGMNTESLELFERDLYAEANQKEGLIIDVRDNGGGFTTDMLLTILTQPVHAYTVGRDGNKGYPQDRLPLYRWTKPIVVLCNDGSFSNAEIFSHAIQVIRRGKVIGTETAGGVISTGGWQTIDGGYFRLPFRGWYRVDTQQNLENGGCVPDLLVPLTPYHRMQKKDPQLETAVQVLLQTK